MPGNVRSADKIIVSGTREPQRLPHPDSSYVSVLPCQFSLVYKISEFFSEMEKNKFINRTIRLRVVSSARVGDSAGTGEDRSDEHLN